MVRIALDAGHGLSTPGKRVPISLGYGDIREWTLNNKIITEVDRLLKDYEDVSTIRLDDPTGRTDIPLATRANKANDFKADILVSSHHNAGINGGTGGGLVLYRYPNSTKFTTAMQRALYDSILKETGLKGNRASPLTSANFQILRQSTMAAILIEHGFMDSRTDIREITKSDWHIKNARGIVNWLVSHYDLKKKPIPSQTNNDGYYRVVVGSFKDKSNAEEQQRKLKEKGFDSFLAYYE